MNKKILYKKAYRILENTTPLKKDCGTLCNKACCSGDENTGMYLFPGEEILLQSLSDSFAIKEIDSSNKLLNSVKLVVCKGSCYRKNRPLSCRIFPLTPYISTDDKLEIIMDPRAKSICPIAKYSSAKDIDKFFVKRVRNLSHFLLRDKDIESYIFNLSRVMDDYLKFFL